MLQYLIDNYLSKRFELTARQVVTLLALLEVSAMDYQIVETLQLYPRSKMRKRVLDPLHGFGWIIFHSLPPANSDIGAPRIAWSLRSDRRAELLQAVNEAEKWAARQLKKGRDVGKRLSGDLYL